MTEAEFWNATPAEVERRQWAYLWRVEEDHTLGVTVAWLAASWQRAKRMPSLAKALGRDRPRIVTPEERERLDAEHARMSRELG